MPKIDVYTAQTKPAVPDQPLRFSETGESPVPQLANQGTALALQWGNIAGRIEATRDDLEFTVLKGQYDAGVDLIHQELAKDPTLRRDARAYEQAFVQKSAELERNIRQTAGNKRVSTAFGNYTLIRQPVDYVKTRGIAYTLEGAYTVGLLEQAENDLSQKAAETEGAAEQLKVINEYGELVSRAEARGFLKPEAAEKRRQSFEVQFRTKRMDYMARTDPEALISQQLTGEFSEVAPEVQEKYLERARTVIREREAKTAKVLKDTDEFVWEWAVSEAHNGRLPESYYKDIIDGKNPFIPSTKAKQLREIMDNPTAASTGVAAIMQDFYSGSFATPEVTLQRISQTRATLHQHLAEGGQGGKQYIDALKELKSAEIQAGGEIRTLAAAARAVEAQDRARTTFAQSQAAAGRSALHEKFRYAEEYYDSQIQILSPFVRRMLPNLKPQDMGTINQLIRKGTEPADAVNQVIQDRVKALGAPKSERKKDLDTLFGGR